MFNNSDILTLEEESYAVEQLSVPEEESIDQEIINKLEQKLKCNISSMDDLKLLIKDLYEIVGEEFNKPILEIILDEIEKNNLIIAYNPIILSFTDFNNLTLFGKNSHIDIDEQLEADVFNLLLLVGRNTGMLEDETKQDLEEEIHSIEVLLEHMSNLFIMMERAKICLEQEVDPRKSLMVEIELEEGEEISEERMAEEDIDEEDRINIIKFITEYLVNLDVGLRNIQLHTYSNFILYNEYFISSMETYQSTFPFFETLFAKTVETLGLQDRKNEGDFILQEIKIEYFLQPNNYVNPKFNDIEMLVMDSMEFIQEKLEDIMFDLDMLLTRYYISSLYSLTMLCTQETGS